MKKNIFSAVFLLKIFLGGFVLHGEETENGNSTSPLMFLDSPGREKTPEQKEFFVQRYGRRKHLADDAQNEEERLLLEEGLEESDEEEEGELFLTKDRFSQEGHVADNTPHKNEVINPISIIHRGYINLNIPEFEAIAGASRGPQSRTYNSLVQQLKQYQKEKNKTQEETLSFLSGLAKEAKRYINLKENSLFKERKKIIPSPDLVERACRRIDGCQLLLNGIRMERLRLDNPENTLNYSPLYGHQIRGTQIMSYQSSFASGMVSQVACFKLNETFPREFVFKPVRHKNISELHAEQLGFSKELIATGVTEEEANFLGRALATYKIDQLLGFDLVPEVNLISLELEGNKQIGSAQRYIDGEELYSEKTMNLFEEDLASLFGGVEQAEEYLAEVATGRSEIQEGWKLYFSDLDILHEVTPDKPLLEEGKKVSFERAITLAKEGRLFFQKKELYAVNQNIDFSDPILQKSLSNIQLLHLITGEQDPNPKNFIFKQGQKGHWRAYSIDHDLSFPRDFLNIEDDALERRRFDKNVRHVLKMPLLIDQEMGEAVLGLTPEKVRDALQATRLTTPEIEATIARLLQVQDYIKKEKEEGGYVSDLRDPSFQQCGLVWGSETYEMLKQLPDRSYLAIMLKAKAYKEKELQAILEKKNPKKEREKLEGSKFLKPPILSFELTRQKSLTGTFHDDLLRDGAEIGANKESEDFGHGLYSTYYSTVNWSPTQLISAFRKGQQDAPEIYGVISSLPKSTKFSASDDSIEHDDSEQSVLNREISGQTISAIETVNLNQFISAIRNVAGITYEEFKNKIESLIQPSFFSFSGWNSSSPISEEAQKLIFDNNTLRFTAEKLGEEAQHFFVQLSGKNFTPIVQQDPWKEVLRMFDEAERAWKIAIEALEQEEHSLSHELYSLRQDDLKKAKKKQEVLAVEFLWVQLYEAEHRAQSEEQGFIHAQQAWRILASHLTPSFQDPSKTWERQFKIAESLTSECTELFPYWIKAVQSRYKSLVSRSTPLSVTSLSIHNADEIRLWDDLLDRFYKMTEILKTGSNNQDARIKQTLWSGVIQEIGFQKLYAQAQKATIDVLLLQKEIGSLAQDNIIQTTTHVAKITRFGYPMTYVELMSIAGVNNEKLNDLCSFWNQLKKGVSIEKQAWSAVFESRQQLTSNKKLKNEKPLQDHSEQTRNAWFFFQVQRATLLAEQAIEKFSKLNFSQASSPVFSEDCDREPRSLVAHAHRFEQAINNFPLDDVVSKLKEAQKLCDQLSEVGALDHPTSWKPTFPSHQLFRSVEKQESGEAEDYLFLNFYKEEVMKSFLNQIDDFPSFIQFQTPLEEMLGGAPDQIKQEWSEASQKMKKLRNDLQHTLDQLALFRGY